MKFSIDAGTFTLKDNKSKPNNILLGVDKTYRIPIYQRPYSWTRSEITKIISDIFESFWGYDGDSESEPIFIGTMQLSNNKNNRQDIIDGQQRITTFLITLKVLKLQYPELSDIQNLKFDWLETKVNNGKQQEKLDELIALKSFENIEYHGLNRYIENALIIRDLISNHIEESEIDFNPSDFAKHIFSNIYFVVIETNASLSKTLKIFDSINTTGLDLNAGDVFKIRMFEYLNEDGENDEVFNLISHLYETIDERNNRLGFKLTDITGILGIYQIFLIAKYNLPTVLYNFGVNTFYERLFDTLFNINKWEHFKNNVEDDKLKLRLCEIKEIINIRYDWEEKWRINDYGNAKNKNLLLLLKSSRYGRYWTLIFIFLFVYRKDNEKYIKLYEFTEKLSKVYLLYSIVYQKGVNKIKNRFNNKLISLLVHDNYEHLITHIDEELYKNSEWEKKRLNQILNNNIVFNSKLKYILCRLSALLEENHETRRPDKIKEITDKLFFTNIDIEHIQSFNDEDSELRKLVHDEWGENLNSIGNLVILERSLNRSIKNYGNKKLHNYKKSKFIIVNKILVDTYNNWNLEKCKERKQYEANKITKFIFE